MVAAVHAGQTPQHKAEAVVRIQAQANIPRRVQFALQLHGLAERGGGAVGDLREEGDGS